MLEVKEVLVGDMSVKQSLSGEINNGVEVIYPSLIDLEVTPSKEVQTFKHEGSYGYDVVTVKAVEGFSASIEGSTLVLSSGNVEEGELTL